MKKILFIFILSYCFLYSFGQGITVRTQAVTSTAGGSTYNKGIIQDANLKALLTLNIPNGTEFTHNNSNPSVGNIYYKSSTQEFGIWNGTAWKVINSGGGSSYSFLFGLNTSGTNISVDTTLIRTVANSWTKAQSDVRYMRVVDGIVRLDSIRVSGMNVTVYSPVQWRINNVPYQKLTNTVFAIPAATSSYNRIDLIYANTSNQVLKIQGTETIGVALEPTLPINSVRLAPVYITGSSISPPTIDLTNYALKDGSNAIAGSSWNINAKSATLWGGYEAYFLTGVVAADITGVPAYNANTNRFEAADATSIRTWLNLGTASTLNASTSSTPNLVAQRDFTGSIFANYLNMSLGLDELPIDAFIARDASGYVRSYTKNAIKTKLGISGINEYTDNSAAITAGLSIGDFYRTGDILKVVH